MSETHTPEPWRYENDGESVLLYADGEYVGEADCRHADIETDEINARRIVACVNACQGVSTEVLETDHINQALELLELIWEMSGDSADPRSLSAWWEVRAMMKIILTRLGRLPGRESAVTKATQPDDSGRKASGNVDISVDPDDYPLF